LGVVFQQVTYYSKKCLGGKSDRQMIYFELLFYILPPSLDNVYTHPLLELLYIACYLPLNYCDMIPGLHQFYILNFLFADCYEMDKAVDLSVTLESLVLVGAYVRVSMLLIVPEERGHWKNQFLVQHFQD